MYTSFTERACCQLIILRSLSVFCLYRKSRLQSLKTCSDLAKKEDSSPLSRYICNPVQPLFNSVQAWYTVFNTFCSSGKGHPHPHRDVLNRERPAHSDSEGQEERNGEVLQIPDRRAVRWDQNVKR